MQTMKRRSKGSGNPSRKSAKPARDQARIVEAMAAQGFSADVIAASLGIDRNTLRGRHALSLYNGRRALKKQKAAEAGDMTRVEMCAADVILSAFDGDDWFAPDGSSDLWPGLNGGNAKTPADAFAEWLRDGGRLITAGVDKSFGAERIAEFRQLKAEAKKLLDDR